MPSANGAASSNIAQMRLLQRQMEEEKKRIMMMNNNKKKKIELKVGVKLRAVSSIKRKVRLRFFVLKGPGLEFDLVPTIHRVTFKRNRRCKESEVCYLGFKSDDTATVYEQDSLHFRIGLVDTRRRVAPEFSTDAPARLHADGSFTDTDYESDSELTSSTEIDDDSDEYSIGLDWP